MHPILTQIKNSPAGRRSDNAGLFHEETKKKSHKRKTSPNVLWIEERLKEWCQERNYTLKTEHRFNPHRKFKFDFAIEEINIAVEYEGGIWMKGGGAHSRPANIERDIAKYNLAQSEGWTVIRLHARTFQNIITELEKIQK